GAASLTFNPALGVERVVALDLQRVAPNQLVGLLRDVTAERNRESALDQARADAEALAAGRARFLANMSHELRTPLNAIMGFSDIMRAKMFGPLTDRYAEYAELIHESGGHLLDLINDVLDMSKIEAERFELQRGVFDAREAVQAAMRLLRVQSDTAGVQLRGVLPPGELEVDADRRALKQIVLNLVSNALKFTPRGGQVTVTAHGYDGVLEIVVADTGVGISPEDLERLGRPYEQAGGPDQRARGTGLGLSLVRAFAKLHGGEMSIESRLGAGTSVSVRLPVLLAPLKPAEATDAANTESRPAPTDAPKPAASLGDNVIAFAALRRD
ncbi:HAMP domain-containing sensor histidine kinase, partial [Caulobacter sp. SSI4214]|uniref:sensor histidine kinase n=1 Tax=Caulobacter sp. SSI4214 TaxID=2575739 RepID=UPI00143A68F0